MFNDAIYKKCTSTPQGGKASRILADLYLYYYERNNLMIVVM